MMSEHTQANHAEDRAEQLLAMTVRLTGLLDEEIAAVKARKLDSSSANWDEKERLVHAWRLEVSRIKADPAQMSGLSSGRKEALKVAARELEDRLQAHERALSAARTVTEGLVRSIAAEIAESRSAPAGYGSKGAPAGGSRREASGLAVDAKA
jgi:hypothetical protein